MSSRIKTWACDRYPSTYIKSKVKKNMVRINDRIGGGHTSSEINYNRPIPQASLLLG